jgi:hypothetical protein
MVSAELLSMDACALEAILEGESRLNEVRQYWN